MTSAFPPIDGGVVNASPTDPNQPRSPTGITPPLGTAARSEATGTPVPTETIQHSNQRANTHINPFQSGIDPTAYGERIPSPGRRIIDDSHAGETRNAIAGDGFGQHEQGRKASDSIPFPQVAGRHPSDKDEGEEQEAHIHRITSNGPVSSHSHIVACTDDHPKDERSTGERAKESASGLKGLAAAVHGVGEKVRGGFNAGVDRAFNDVCEPPKQSFPHLGVLREWTCDEDGEGLVWQEERKQENHCGNVGDAKNRDIATDGTQEIESGNFSERTKVREGILGPAHGGAKGGKRID